jgi:FAD/FMN-containing dehydrogenase
MQFVLGCRPEGAPSNVREIVMKQFEKSGNQVTNGKETGEYHPGFLHEWNDLRQVYRGNFDRLKEMKKKYDPENRFNKGVDLVNETVTAGSTV